MNIILENHIDLLIEKLDLDLNLECIENEYLFVDRNGQVVSDRYEDINSLVKWFDRNYL